MRLKPGTLIEFLISEVIELINDNDRSYLFDKSDLILIVAVPKHELSYHSNYIIYNKTKKQLQHIIFYTEQSYIRFMNKIKIHG